jgi:hypothetical protein
VVRTVGHEGASRGDEAQSQGRQRARTRITRVPRIGRHRFDAPAFESRSPPLVRRPSNPAARPSPRRPPEPAARPSPRLRTKRMGGAEAGRRERRGGAERWGSSTIEELKVERWWREKRESWASKRATSAKEEEGQGHVSHFARMGGLNPAWSDHMVCHISKSGKNVSKTSQRWSKYIYHC